MWQSVEILNDFNTLTLEQIFSKTKTFFKKLEYCFLVENTTIENPSFPYKTAISEANVKTKRKVSTKWTYHKEISFASNHIIFLRILLQFKNFERIDLMYQRFPVRVWLLPTCRGELSAVIARLMFASLRSGWKW